MTWVQEDASNHSAKGEGDLKKNVCNFPFMFLLWARFTEPHIQYFNLQKERKVLKWSHVASGKDGYSWGMTGRFSLHRYADSTPESHLPMSNPSLLHDAVGSYVVVLWQVQPT